MTVIYAPYNINKLRGNIEYILGKPDVFKVQPLDLISSSFYTGRLSARIIEDITIVKDSQNLNLTITI